MFFDEIKLSKKSWHYKLQSWMFNVPPFEDNFCPYFWLTIFCLFIAPFVAAIRFFPAAVIKVGEFFSWPFIMLSDVFEQRICKPLVENRIRSLSDSEIFHIYRYSDLSFYGGYDHKMHTKCYAQFIKWRAITGDSWVEELEKIKLRMAARYREEEKFLEKLHKKRKEEERKEALKRAERRKKFAKIVNYTKWVVLPLIGIIGVLVVIFTLYVLALGLVWLVKLIVAHWNWKAAAVVATILGLLVGGALFVVLVITLFKKLSSCLQVMVSNLPSKPKRIEPSRMGQFFGTVGKAIVSPFQIFIDYVKVFKQNNCPAIKWDNENK